MSEERKLNDITKAIIVATIIIIIGVIIGNTIYSNRNKQYFYGYNNMNGHCDKCYATDTDLICEIPLKVDWFYEEDEHK